MNLRELTKRYGRGIGLSISAVRAYAQQARRGGGAAWGSRPCCVHGVWGRQGRPDHQAPTCAPPLPLSPPISLPPPARQMLVSLYHLRNCGVLHADIKPDNIL